MKSNDNSINLSLLQHDFKTTRKDIKKPIMFKVNQVRKQLKLQKLREAKKNLEQKVQLHKDIFVIITRQIKSNKIRIYEFYKLVQHLGISLNFETIEHLFRMADSNKDYSLHYEEFLFLIQNDQTNRFYTQYAKSIVKEKLKQAQKSNQVSQNREYINILEHPLDNREIKMIPMTLNGLFFHIGHLICRQELFNQASDTTKLTEERYDAMRNLMRLVEINNNLQQNEGNYDEELKHKYKQKFKLDEFERKSQKSQQLNLSQISDPLRDSSEYLTNRIPQIMEESFQLPEINDTNQFDVNLTQISQLNSGGRIFSFQEHIQLNEDSDNVEEEVENLVRNAKNQGIEQAVSIIHNSQDNLSNIYSQVELNSSITRRNRMILRLPQIPHSFGDRAGTIRRSYQLPMVHKGESPEQVFPLPHNTRKMPQYILEKLGLYSKPKYRLQLKNKSTSLAPNVMLSQPDEERGYSTHAQSSRNQKPSKQTLKSGMATSAGINNNESQKMFDIEEVKMIVNIRGSIRKNQSSQTIED